MASTRTIQLEFAKQASGFGDPRLTLARPDYLEWMLRHLPLERSCRVLDVGAGTGHLSRALAPRAGWVLAVDLTIEMLRELAKEGAAQKVSNLALVQALGENLPVRDGTFDLVVSRLAFHHFDQPAHVLREMVRTCKVDGTIGVIDLVAPDDATLAQSYNSYERRRDPSHARALSQDEMRTLLQDAGLRPVLSAARDVEVGVEPWLALAQTPSTIGHQLRRHLLAEVQGGEATGMRPFWRGDDLMFLHRWLITVAQKTA
jgi:SAM-dependent methyltransferase